MTLQVEREFYNAGVAAGSFQVDASVFLHRVGDIDSYPSEADADALIATGGLGPLGPLGDLVDALGNPLQGLQPAQNTHAGASTSAPVTIRSSWRSSRCQ